MEQANEIIQQAQERLLQKREERVAMVNPTPSTTSFEEIKELLPNCQHGNKVGYCDECKKELLDEEDNHPWEKERRLKDTKEREKTILKHRDDPGYYMRSFIPKKFLDRSLDNFVGSDAVKKLCIEYSNKFIREVSVVKGKSLFDNGLSRYPGSVLFTGKTGCGKTHLAVAIIRELVKRMAVNDIRFITAPELLLEIRSTFNSKTKHFDDYGVPCDKTEEDILSKYSTCELLVLDDLGAEKVTDFTIQSLYLVIDRRNRNLRPTIVTTNLSLEEIENLIDARMASRLADMTVVRLTMPDYRKKR